MRTNLKLFAACLLLSTINHQLSTARAQGTAFGYEGRLNTNGTPSTGVFDFQFYLRDALTAGNAVGTTNTVAPVGVTNGLFNVTLNFTNSFTGAPRWLEIGVRTNGSAAAYATLGPRQPILPTPYAITASNFTGTVQASQLTGGTVADARLSANVALLSGCQNFSGFNFFGNEVAANGLRLNDSTLWFRDDLNHGLRWCGIGKPFGGSSNLVDGPVLFGFGGGAVGTKQGSTEKIALGWNSAGAVGIGTNNPVDSVLDVEGPTHINDNDIYLRSGSNRDHGFGYRNSFVGAFVDGPLLYGYNGGALGTSSPDSISLLWYYTGDVTISNNLSAVSLTVDRLGNNAGALTPGFIFGGSSGEGIASKRNAGGNQNGLDFYTAFQNRMAIANGGNVGIGTNLPQQKLHVIGNILATGTVTGGSDRNTKANFGMVNVRGVLEKVAAMPITEWNYKADDETLRHIGPMAQDFYAAFHVGVDDRHISMVDADGVALAAIQGLNQKLEEQRAENAELKQNLAELKKLVQSISKKK